MSKKHTPLGRVFRDGRTELKAEIKRLRQVVLGAHQENERLRTTLCQEQAKNNPPRLAAPAPVPVPPLTAEEISMLRAWLKRPRNWSA